MNDLITAVHRITTQLNTRANPDLRGLPETILRAFKIQEEAGELAQAIIGVLGQNPRKGVTHTWDNAVAEAIDVALTALVFVETIRPGQLTAILADRLAYLAARATASGAPQVTA